MKFLILSLFLLTPSFLYSGYGSGLTAGIIETDPIFLSSAPATYLNKAQAFTTESDPIFTGSGIQVATGTINADLQASKTSIASSTTSLKSSQDALALSTGTLVRKSGDTMTGNLTTTSSITIQGSEFSVGGSTLVVSGGRVGIGNATPSFDLSVKGIAPTMSMESGEGQANTMYFRSAVNRWNIQRTGLYDLQFYDYGGTAGVRLALQSGGNIGINTTAPTHKLDVNGGAIVRSSMTVVGETFVSTMTVSGGVNISGNVGIGTTGPKYLLDIQRNTAGEVINMRLSGDSGADDGGAGVILAENNILKWHIFQRRSGTPTNSLAFSTVESLYASAKMLITTAGNVGIGTVTPAQKLHIVGSMTITENIIPVDNKVSSLGSPTQSWLTVYASSYYVTTPDLIKKEEAYNWLVGISTKPKAGTLSKIDKATYGNAYKPAKQEDKIERQVRVDLNYNELPPNNEEIIVETLPGGTTIYYYEKTETLLPEDAIDLGQSMINMIYLNKKLLDEIADLKSRITTLELR